MAMQEGTEVKDTQQLIKEGLEGTNKLSKKNETLNELMKKGFNCNIRVVKTPIFHENKSYNDITYILEVIK